MYIHILSLLPLIFLTSFLYLLCSFFKEFNSFHKMTDLRDINVPMHVLIILCFMHHFIVLCKPFLATVAHLEFTCNFADLYNPLHI